MPIPGASSVTTLLSAAGELAPEGWLFRGFLPHKGQARTQALADCAADPRPQVLLESPHRIETLASALASMGQRLVSVGRELTKQFEEVDTVPCATLSDWLQAHPHRTKGEFVLLLHASPDVPADAAPGLTTLKVLMSELSLSQAARLAAQLTGESRKRLYDAGLALSNDTAQAQLD
jgi:16S rRNA (cytidine1402-2'-O)-methyltransferase